MYLTDIEPGKLFCQRANSFPKWFRNSANRSCSGSGCRSTVDPRCTSVVLQRLHSRVWVSLHLWAAHFVSPHSTQGASCSSLPFIPPPLFSSSSSSHSLSTSPQPHFWQKARLLQVSTHLLLGQSLILKADWDCQLGTEMHGKGACLLRH